MFGTRRATEVFANRLVLLVTLGAMAAPALALGQAAPAQDAAALAKKLSNPVADLVSIPLQFNWAQGVGPEDDTRFILNVQPVIPLSMGPKWNMIMRVIMPFIGQPPLTEGGAAATGLGDVLASFFFSPKESSVIWGVGPALGLPSTAEATLGSGKWLAGPTFVVLKQSRGLTYGALANQVWSVAGNSSRADVSQLFVQPFLSYTSKAAVSFTINSESTHNWEAASGNKWTIPVNLMVAKMATFGPFPASYGGGIGYYLDKPAGGPDWQLRGIITVLLPKR
jgi:hypothetical protein